MGGHAELPTAARRRDALVQQLLSERQQRLEAKLSTAAPDSSQHGAAVSPWRLAAPQAGCPPSREVEGRLPSQHGAVSSTAPAVQAPCLGQGGGEARECHPEARRLGPGAAAAAAASGRLSGGSNGATSARGIGLNLSPAAALRPRSAPPTQETRESFRSRLQQWTLRQQAFELRQRQARQEKESRESQQCTFKPTINGRSDFFARRSRRASVEPLAERLHHEADRRSTLREKAKELLEADELCAHSFRPEINNNNSRSRAGSSKSQGGEGSSWTPIHLRSEEILQMRQEHQRSLQALEEMRSECSFQPRICAGSDKIMQRKKEKLYRSLSSQGRACGEQPGALHLLRPVEDRLYALAKSAEERKAAKQEIQNEAAKHAPTPNEESKRLWQTSIFCQGPQQDFLTRQQTFELAKQHRLEVRARHAEAAECPFHPRISDTSRQLVAFDVQTMGETVQERVHRLAVKDRARREEVREALGQLHYRDCTFKPAVSLASQMLASRAVDDASSAKGSSGDSVHERLYKSALAGKAQNQEPSAEEEEACPFRPQMDPRSMKSFAHIRPHYASNGSDIMESIRSEVERREEHLLEKRRQVEEAKRAECTFVPSIAPRPLEEPRQPISVSGLDRFFELRNIAQRQQQERKDCEAKAFRPEHEGKRFGGVTIPEPFNLSANKSTDTSELRRLQEELPECTFVPRTTEASKRELLRQLMLGPGLVEPPLLKALH